MKKLHEQLDNPINMHDEKIKQIILWIFVRHNTKLSMSNNTQV